MINKSKMVQVNSLEEYDKVLKRFENCDEVYYRGQLEKYETITPSVARNGFIGKESVYYNETIKDRKDDFKKLKTDFEVLAKMRHYGIPTRLIDLTINKYIALFFAVSFEDNEQGMSNGDVYVYVAKGCDHRDKRVKILSLLPTLSCPNAPEICDKYAEKYNDIVSVDEVLETVNQSLFVKHSDDFVSDVNPRLKIQQGTFFLCGNVVADNHITSEIKPLDSVTPNLIIRVPYEYRQSILNELDIKQGINKAYVYPELTVYADFLIGKFQSPDNTVSDQFSIVKREDVSFARIRRTSLSVVMNEKMGIEKLKNTILSVIKNERKDNRVIWVLVALNHDDYISYNWVLRCLWIDPELSKDFRPIPLKCKDDENNCSWDFSKSYSTMSDFNSEYVFEENNVLYVRHRIVWEKVQSAYNRIKTAYYHKEWNDFISEYKEQSTIINAAFNDFQDFGCSRDKDFNDFLRLFTDVTILFDEIKYCLNKDSLSDSIKMTQIKKIIDKAETMVTAINNDLNLWAVKLKITEQDYSSIDLDVPERKKYSYTPTLPISKNAVNVNFNINKIIHSDNTLHIEADTNLFDDASLMLSMRDCENLHCSAKATVKNGKVVFPTFSNGGKGLRKGTYQCTIILSLPSLQPQDFIKCAGIEYENLTGDFICRDSVAPYGHYEFTIEI